MLLPKSFYVLKTALLLLLPIQKNILKHLWILPTNKHWSSFLSAIYFLLFYFTNGFPSVVFILIFIIINFIFSNYFIFSDRITVRKSFFLLFLKILEFLINFYFFYFLIIIFILPTTKSVGKFLIFLKNFLNSFNLFHCFLINIVSLLFVF